jgi:Na+/proline symporter
MNETILVTIQNVKHFNWAEYLVFGGMLLVSVLIGIYFGCVKGQHTVSEYLLGSRKMRLFPVAMSLIAR